MSHRRRDDAHGQPDDAPTRTMKDVSHTPPEGESVTNVWHRGSEAAD